MSKNTEYIYSNQVVVGEDAGTPYMVGRNQKLNTETNIVAEDRTPVITFTDSTNTIDFHNKPVVNFSGGGGGGGGDTFLAGGTGLTTPQVFTGFNRMTNDTQFADGVLFSDDGTNINGKIHATASQLHIETNNVLDTISMKLAPAGSTNTLELKQDPDATTQNGLFIQQVAGSSTLDKVLTNSTQDLGVIVDAVEVSPNVFTANNSFTSATTTAGIQNTGGIVNNSGGITNVGGLVNTDGLGNTGGLTSDTMTCQGLLNTQSLTSTTSILGGTVSSNGNVTCAAGSNFVVGSTQIASSNLLDGSLLLNTSATAQLKSGNLTVGQLTSSAGVLNFDTTGGANIQNDTTNNVLLTSTTNLTDGMNWRLGTAGSDSLRLRYDANGGGAGVPRYFLEMNDPSVGPSSYFQLSGNSGYDITNLIALLNNTSLTFNPTTTEIFQGILSHSGNTCNLINGTGNGTLNIGNAASTDAVLIDADTTFRNDVAIATTKDIFSPDLDGGTKGVIEVCDGCVDRTLTSWQPTNTVITPVTGYSNQITNLFQASFIRVQYGTNFQISMRGGFKPNTGTFPSGNFTIANIGSTYAPSSDMYFSYQLQPGVPGGLMNVTPTGNIILIGLAGTETEVYLGGVQYFVD